MLTMADGKVCQALTDTPSPSISVVFKATPKHIEDFDDVTNSRYREKVFSFVLSTLHAWIRLMDCILHQAYNLQFKNAKTASRAHIQEAFRQQTGLIIHTVKKKKEIYSFCSVNRLIPDYAGIFPLFYVSSIFYSGF
jgi:hypothetical protein